MTDTTVNNGQTVSNLDITSGNSLDVSAGGTANNTTVENGGSVTVEAATNNGLGGLGGLFGPTTGGALNGITVNSGGSLDLQGSNSSASNIVLNGANLRIDATASVTGSLTFGPTTGTESSIVSLVGNDANFRPTVTGFSASSALDDNAIQFSGATLTTTFSNGDTIATLTGSGVTNTFTLAGTEQLKIVPDNGDDSGPEAVIVTTNTTLNFSAFPGDGQQASTASAANAQQASSTARPAMSFLSHPQATTAGTPLGLGMSDATLAQAATKITAGTQSLGSIAHAMTLSPTQDLARSMLGALSNPTGLSSVEARTVFGAGALQHIATAAAMPALTPHLG